MQSIKRPKASIAYSCGLQARAEILTQVLFEIVAVFLTVMVLQFTPCFMTSFIILNSHSPIAAPTLLSAQGVVIQHQFGKSCWPLSSTDSVNFLCDNDNCQSIKLTCWDTTLAPPLLFLHSKNHLNCRLQKTIKGCWSLHTFVVRASGLSKTFNHIVLCWRALLLVIMREYERSKP